MGIKKLRTREKEQKDKTKEKMMKADKTKTREKWNRKTASRNISLENQMEEREVEVKGEMSRDTRTGFG